MGKKVKLRGRLSENVRAGLVIAGVVACIPLAGYGIHMYDESTRRNEKAKHVGISVDEVVRYEDEGVSRGRIHGLFKNNITPQVIQELKKTQKIGFDEIEKMSWPHSLKGDTYIAWSNAGLTVHETASGVKYGISSPETGALVKKVVPDFNFYQLEIQSIPAKESVPLMVAGNSIDAVIQQYSDAVGITPKDRLTYVQQGFDTNDTITPLHEAGVTAQMLPNLRHNLTPELTLDLVDLDRLNGDIYNHWNSDEFMAGRSTGLFIWRGYDREECKKWIPGGYTADQMDRAMQSGRSIEEMNEFTTNQWIMRAPEN